MAFTVPRNPASIASDDEQKIRTVFRLLEVNLLPEERDKASPGYRLGWYDKLQAGQFDGADLERFRGFVDDMAERALMLSHRTEAIFPSDSVAGLNADWIDRRILQARSICESLCRS